ETDYLAAYFTADENVDITALREHAAKYLTAYMVPQAFLQLETMPMTANGKIDKRMLPEIRKTVGAGSVKKPENELQRILCDLFSKALGMEVGIDDDFFAMGGTSLSAAKVLMGAKVQNLLMEYQDIFDAKTVEKLEMLLRSRQMKGSGEAAVQKAAETGEDPGIARVLAHNTREFADEIRQEKIGSVLLAGTTGFLGIHVLRELIEQSSCRIICLVNHRKTAKSVISPESRLRLQLFYYFEKNYEELIGDRIKVIERNVSDADGIMDLEKEDFDTVINCAAIVKHFADFNELKEVNVGGVENLIRLCLKKKARLIQLSTVSVSGEALDDWKTEKELTENCLNIGQEVTSNAYVYTKYLAEEMVLRAVATQGLDAKIMRLGNLMSRQQDGEFQINFRTNNFMNSLRAYAALGCFPYSEMDEQVDFSPIDETARFIIRLAGTPSGFTMFHVYNSHLVDMGDVLTTMVSCGIQMKAVTDDEFKKRLNRGLADDRINTLLSPLVNYDLTDDSRRREIPVDNRFTDQALYRLGLKWSITDLNYLEKMIEMLRTLGFFDRWEN
ncbi:MAG: SDR family oxidoreductase, partial [Eubacterium sp.]|nr:SDR family oxidoreductase [Eubacterium sp.]